MITNEVKNFQKKAKMRKCETRIGKVYEVGPPWHEHRGMARCHSGL